MFRYLWTMTLSIFLTGCLEFPHVFFHANAHQNIRTIAILPPKHIERVTIFYFLQAQDYLHMENALSSAADFSLKMDIYNRSIFPAIFAPNAYFLSSLRRMLMMAGYHVIILPYRVRGEKFLSRYPRTIADAFLDLRLGGVGYIANDEKSPYLPSSRLSARLIEQPSNAILYDSSFAVGNASKLEQDIRYLGANTAYEYETFETLNSHALESVDGLRGALDTLAQQIATDLQKTKKGK